MRSGRRGAVRDLLDRLVAWLLVLLGVAWGVSVLIEMIRPLIGWIALAGLVGIGGWLLYRRWRNTHW